MRTDYLTAEPVDDARFVGAFAHALEHTGGYAPPEAKRVAKTLLPDLLYYDSARPASFPDNGRTLTDDTGSYFLSLLTNGKVTTDGVCPQKDLLTGSLRGSLPPNSVVWIKQAVVNLYERIHYSARNSGP